MIIILLNTSSKETIIKSLEKILNSNEDKIKKFYRNNNIINLHNYDNETICNYRDKLLEYFRIDYINITDITIHHISNRLELDEKAVTINNLIEVLLKKNSLTNFLKTYDIIFKKEQNEIIVYYKGNKLDFNKNSLAYERLNNLKDICVNGFLLSDYIDSKYIYLGTPEIVGNILKEIERKDIGYKYMEKAKLYIITFKISFEKIIIDDLNRNTDDIDIEENKIIIIANILSYLHKIEICRSNIYKNLIIRLPETISISNEYIISCNELKDFSIFD